MGRGESLAGVAGDCPGLLLPEASLRAWFPSGLFFGDGGRLMAILVDAGTRVIGQGITGRQGTFHAEQSSAYGTRFVACVTPARVAAGICIFPCTIGSPTRWRRWERTRRSSTFRPITRPMP